jgi:RNA polymerase sigma factor (sigma-70 family)
VLSIGEDDALYNAGRIGKIKMGASLEGQLLEHRDALLGFLLALTRNPQSAEEIFQEVALAIIEESRRGAQVEKFLPWAHEIARRRVQEHYRKQRRWQPLPVSMTEVVVTAFEENPVDAQALRTRQELLLECIKGLARRARQLVHFRYVEGKTPTAIAAQLGQEVASVNVTLSRTRRALEHCVERRFRAGAI